MVRNRRLSAALPMLLFAALPACGTDTTKTGATNTSSPALPLVRVEPVVVREVRREIETTTFLESERHVLLLSKVAGRVLEVLVDEGQAVEKGQLLARLDERESASALRQVEVQLEDRSVRLDLARLEAEASKRRVEQARLELARTEGDYRRNKDIAEGFIAPKLLEDARFAYENAAQSLLVAEFNQRKAELDVKAAENAILELQAKKEEAGIRLSEHRILAPFDGVLVRRSITGGETISSSTELFTLIDPHHLVAYLSRPQRELPLLQQAREVLFHTDARPGQEFTGVIDLVSPVIEQATGSFRLRMRVRREDTEVLRPGMFLRARIQTESTRMALMVPKAAVLADGETSVVFTVRDGIATRITLDAGLEERLHVECRNRGDDGLADSDLVVTSGNERLRDQTRVEVTKS